MSSILQEILRAGLLDEYDSAFLLMDFDVLEKQLLSLSKVFSDKTKHAIAIKTNPVVAVLSHIVDSGYMLEAASFEELLLAERAGATAQQLVFDSPVKRHWEIKACEERWPGMVVNANNINELSRFSLQSGLRIGLRINTLVETSVDRLYNVSGSSSKFGVPVSMREEIISACLQFPVTGLHMHSGSSINDVLGNLNAVSKLLELAIEINCKLSSIGSERKIEFLDVGGGLAAGVGIAGMTNFADAVTALPGIEDFQVITEFGQWTHAPVGSAFSRVESVDELGKLRPQAYVHLGADYFMRDAYSARRQFVYNIYDGAGNLKTTALDTSIDIVGPLCFAGDILAEDVVLPTVCEDDWLGVSGVGANTYGLWSRHCSRDIPKIIGKKGSSEYSIIQERQAISF